MRSHFFDIEILFGLPVTGSFIAEDGRICSITMPNETVVTFQGRTPWMVNARWIAPSERQLVELVRDELEIAFEDEIAATEHIYDERPYEPIRLGVRTGVAM